MNILILEDAIPVASTWRSELTRFGHTVNGPFVRVTSLDDASIRGEDAEGVSSTVAIASIDLAFCDGLLLLNTTLQGFECVPVLLTNGVPCVSTSSGGDITLGRGLHVEKQDVLNQINELLDHARALRCPSLVWTM